MENFEWTLAVFGVCLSAVLGVSSSISAYITLPFLCNITGQENSPPHLTLYRLPLELPPTFLLSFVLSSAQRTSLSYSGNGLLTLPSSF